MSASAASSLSSARHYDPTTQYLTLGMAQRVGRFNATIIDVPRNENETANAHDDAKLHRDIFLSYYVTYNVRTFYLFLQYIARRLPCSCRYRLAQRDNQSFSVSSFI
jgi:hypothetical protein